MQDDRFIYIQLVRLCEAVFEISGQIFCPLFANDATRKSEQGIYIPEFTSGSFYLVNNIIMSLLLKINLFIASASSGAC